MTQHPAWATLGIDPTGDQRAIRSAYSARLKEIDPEVDPQAFIDLREAFEAARAGAAWHGEAEAEHSDGDWTPEPASSWTRAEPGDADRHAQALVALLHAQGKTAFGLDAAQEAQALAHWRAIAADPRMQDIGHFADVEQWASHLIADAPRSAILVIPATEFFGWTRSAGTIAQTAAVAEVSRRYQAQQFILAAQHPGHSHYPALAELTTRAYPGSSRGRVPPLTVHLLLAIVRDAWPEIEARFDSARVALWKHNTADPDSPESRAARGEGQRPIALWFTLGWFALIALGALGRAIGGQ
ncbi:MAG: hypothetical protein V4574_03195 [Pseudomonadota bacterium]